MADISFLSILALIWGLQFWSCSSEQDGIIEKKALIGERVHLTCHSNSSADVVWSYAIEDDFSRDIFICQGNQKGPCTPTAYTLTSAYWIFVSKRLNVTAIRGNETSTLSLIPTKDGETDERTFTCSVGSLLLRQFLVKSIDSTDTGPNCSVASPRSDANGVGSIALFCEVYSEGLDVTLTFGGIESNISDNPASTQSIGNVTVISETLHLEDFSNIYDASCNAQFSYITNRSCTYPNIIKTDSTVEGDDIIVNCGIEADVDWHLYDLDGREEDIKNRSWTREGGRSLLIRTVSERDVRKVVVCRTRGDILSNDTITFTVISKISRDTNEANSGDSKPGPDYSSPYFVPALLFLALWLITTAVCGVWFGCRQHRIKSSTWASTNASIPNAPSESNVNGGANDRETPLELARVGVRGDPDTSNTNNSANNPTFELQGEGPDENGLNRQSNNGSHLYFTLEKPSPSAESSRMASTSGIDRREDTNLASLNQPQSSHWQGYEAVGESDKGAACSYDLGEYAEVGDHHIGRSLPDRSVRPSIPKKPGKEEIKENDISKLYSQVNK